MLILYTDGIVEAKTRTGERFGLERLKGAIEKHVTLAAPEIIGKVLEAVYEFTAGERQHDDISCMMVKRAPLPRALEKEEHSWEEASEEIRVSSDPKMVSLVRAKVGELAKQMGFSEEEVHDIKLAVNEAQANVIEHAYPGTQNGEIVVRLDSYPNRIEISVIDFGKTPNLDFFKIPEYPEKLEGGGFGLFLMKKLMDEVAFNQLPYTFTECHLIKLKNGQEKKV